MIGMPNSAVCLLSTRYAPVMIAMQRIVIPITSAVARPIALKKMIRIAR